MTDTTAPQQPYNLASMDYPAPAAAGAEAPLAGTRRDMPARVIAHRAADVEAWRTSAERIPVFAVTHDDGSHTTYTMPAKPNPGVALGFLRDVRKQGDAAIIGLFEQVLDPGAVDALIDELSAMEGDEAATTMQTISERVQRNLGGGLQR